MGKLITIREYEKIGIIENKNFKHIIEKENFVKLKDFIVKNRLNSDPKFFEIYGNCIIPQNFVGTINVDDISIEILPKIPLIVGNEEAEKKRFVEILEYIETFNENIFEDLEIGNQNMPILEIFISNFIKEVDKIIKKGLIYSYINRSENISYFKGKLDLANHIKYNIVEGKFFMNFDEFSISSIENSLIKLALEKVKNISANTENIEKIYQLLIHFEEINTLELNPTILFNKITFNRKNDFYKKSLDLAKFFLLDESTYSIFFYDNNGVTALFFPMETIYENYIANKLREVINNNENYSNKFSIKIQDNSYRIFDECKFNGKNEKNQNITLFRLKPDVVLENEKEIIILDTKWKGLKNFQENDKIYNYDISKEDIYQMITYIQVYNARNDKSCKRAYLLYPINNNEKNSLKGKIIFSQKDSLENSLEIGTYFIDLSSEKNTNDSLDEMIKKIMNLEENI